MAVVEIGSAIKRLRKQKGITQTELAAKIMDISTLSRIERGIIMPSKYLIEALFQRLGCEPSKIANFLLSSDMVHLEKIIDKINTAIGYKKADELKALIKKLENDDEYMKQPINTQFVLYAKGSLELIEQNPHTALDYLKQAIKITIPDFDADNIAGYMLTDLDRRILLTIAILEKNMGELEYAIKLSYGMKNNYDKHFIDRSDLARNYTVLLFNLAIWLSELKRFDEVIKICEECKKVCIEKGVGFVLPSITCYEAIARHELKMDGCEELFKQSYYGCILFELHKDSEFVKKAAMEKIGLELK